MAKKVCSLIPIGSKVPYTSQRPLEDQVSDLRAVVARTYLNWPTCVNDSWAPLQLKHKLVDTTANPYLEGWLECSKCKKSVVEELYLW